MTIHYLTLGELIEKLIELETDPRCMRTTPTNVTELRINSGGTRSVFLETEDITTNERITELEDELKEVEADLHSANEEIDRLKDELRYA